MHRSEAEGLVLTRCLACGAEISVARDRAFAVSADEALCFDCAVERGGVYDERLDRWVAPADASNLPLEPQRV